MSDSGDIQQRDEILIKYRRGFVQLTFIQGSLTSIVELPSDIAQRMADKISDAVIKAVVIVTKELKQ